MSKQEVVLSAIVAAMGLFGLLRRPGERLVGGALLLAAAAVWLAHLPATQPVAAVAVLLGCALALAHYARRWWGAVEHRH